jgi:hypothetical protein
VVELVRNRQALVLTTVAASLWALGLLLAGLAAATLSPGGAGTYGNLLEAAAWIDLVAGMAVLAATSWLTWNAAVHQLVEVAWEVGATALSSLVLTIGLLMQAVDAPNPSDAGFVVSAVGLGGWAAVVLVRAARRSIEEQRDASLARRARYGVGAAASVAVIAVALGLPSPSLSDATLAVAGNVVYAAGFAGLAVVFSAAHARRIVDPRSFVAVATGLWTLAVASVVQAVSAGAVYGPPPVSIGSLRFLSIGPFIELCGFGALAWAAFSRIGGLALAPVAPAPATTVPHAPLDQPVPFDQPVPSPPGGDESPATLVPPSWHPDPSGRHEFRFWDGTRWTEHVTDGGRPSIDPPE